MRLDAASIAACFRSNCSQLVTLALRHSKLDSEAVAELSRAHQLVAHLRHLYMSNTHLSIAAMTQLSMGNWPSLEQLDLSNSRLDAASIARLATGGWPKLTRLNLNSNWLDASAMMELTHGSWPQLQSLDLSGNRLDDAAVAQMASGHWPQLSSLNLYKNKQVTVLSVADATQITSITMLYLDRTNARTFVQSAVLLWQKQTRVGNALRSESTNLSVSHLQLLNLQSSSLGVCDIAVLVAMALPHLKHLSLHNNPLNEAAIHELIKGHWPELVVLGLSDCTLDNAVLKVLCQGQWLKLQKLYLSSNDIDVVGVQHLQSSWPDLSELELSKRVLSAAGWNAMGLAPDDISQWTHGIAGHGICVARLDQSVDGGIWPELKYVHFPREVTGVSQQEAHSAFWVLTASVLFAVVVLPAVVAFVNTVDIM